MVKKPDETKGKDVEEVTIGPAGKAQGTSQRVKNDKKAKDEAVTEQEETQEAPENTEETQDTETEATPEVTEKIVEVPTPISVEDMTPNERAQLIEDCNNQDIKEHLDKEIKRIESTACPKCGTNLGLKGEDYLKKGNKPELKECKKCHRQIRVHVLYKADPSVSRAKIKTKNRGFAWNTEQPQNWTDKQTTQWFKEEKEKLDKNNSSLGPDGQKLLRVQALILKKLKVIK